MARLPSFLGLSNIPLYNVYVCVLLFSRSVVSDSVRPHGLQHVRLPCPSQSPRIYISSSVIPFSSCLLSFPASGSFPVSQLFVSGGQSIGASASASVPPINIQSWFPLGLTGLISLQSNGESSPAPQFESINFSSQPSSWSNSHIQTWLLAKPELWLYGSLLAQWCLCFLICCLSL